MLFSLLFFYNSISFVFMVLSSFDLSFFLLLVTCKGSSVRTLEYLLGFFFGVIATFIMLIFLAAFYCLNASASWRNWLAASILDYLRSLWMFRSCSSSFFLAASFRSIYNWSYYIFCAIYSHSSRQCLRSMSLMISLRFYSRKCVYN